MVLRILRALREQYRIELSQWTAFASSFRDELDKVSFIQLWGAALWISDHKTARIVMKDESGDGSTGIFVDLDPHLQVLSQGLALPGPSDQLPLFVAVRHA